LAAHEDHEQALQAPPDLLALVEQREAARTQRDWAQADTLRQQAAALGWQIRDTPAGPVVESLR
jgi:cysteinyl-tRNA synthetase